MHEEDERVKSLSVASFDHAMQVRLETIESLIDYACKSTDDAELKIHCYVLKSRVAHRLNEWLRERRFYIQSVYYKRKSVEFAKAGYEFEKQYQDAHPLHKSANYNLVAIQNYAQRLGQAATHSKDPVESKRLGTEALQLYIELHKRSLTKEDVIESAQRHLPQELVQRLFDSIKGVAPPTSRRASKKASEAAAAAVAATTAAGAEVASSINSNIGPEGGQTQIEFLPWQQNWWQTFAMEDVALYRSM